jgi:hypothetical protein
MTGACRQVMDECDFKDSDVRELEVLLLMHSPQQLIRFFWQRDKKGEHGLDWFRPFFDHNFVKRTVDAGLPGPADDDFWLAYEWWDAKMELLSTFDLPKIWTMSRDLRAMKAAYALARVKGPAYVVKVFEEMSQRRRLEPAQATKIDFEVGNSGTVKVGEL